MRVIYLIAVLLAAGIPAASAGQPVEVHVANCGWRGNSLKDLAEVYGKAHLGVVVLVDGGSLRQFAADAPDVAAYRGSLAGHGRNVVEMLTEFYGRLPEERAIAWQPLVAVVHPKNPLESITLDAFRHVAEHQVTAWNEIGAKSEGNLVRYWYRKTDVSEALFPGATMRNISPWLFDPKGVTREERQRRSIEAGRWHRQLKRERDLLEQMAADENGLALVALTPEVPASGLKVLKLESGKGPVAPTLANVGKGEYAARIPHLLLVHPRASQAARDFVQWLQGPDAAATLAAHCLANAASASSKPSAAQESGGPAATRVPTFTGQIAGAVAVLPTQSATSVFFMVGVEHRAAYEQEIADAIAADGRLTVVDREQLRRVLTEREMVLMGLSQGEPAPPLTAADVVLTSQVITEERDSFLELRALHAPTGSVLGGHRVPLSPTDPMAFDPPLQDQVRRWWPQVLSRLEKARRAPVWSLLDVTPDKDGEVPAACEMEEVLRGALRDAPDVFLAEYETFSALKQEVLMSLMGLSDVAGRRFTPAADCLLDVRLPEANVVELRVLGGPSPEPLAGTTIREATAAQALSATVEWVRRQTVTLSGTAGRRQGDDAHQCAARQARLEYERYLALSKRLGVSEATIAYGGSRDDLDRMTDGQRQVLHYLWSWRGRHLARAVQLDPTFEAVNRYRARRVVYESGVRQSFNGLMEAAVFTRLYVEQFGDAPESCEVALQAATVCQSLWQMLAQSRKLPAGLEREKLLKRYRRMHVELLRDYCLRYLAKGRRVRGTWPYVADHYLHWQAKHLADTGADKAEIERQVAEWADNFGEQSKVAPHSDFLRLKVLYWKGDRPGWLAQMTDMQRRHPDPKERYWERAGISMNAIESDLCRLFGCNTGKNAFAEWKRGERGIGDLPYPGYRPRDDLPPPVK